jgi:hypothetical protein
MDRRDLGEQHGRGRRHGEQCAVGRRSSAVPGLHPAALLRQGQGARRVRSHCRFAAPLIHVVRFTTRLGAAASEATARPRAPQASCDETEHGERREARSTSKSFLGGWANATEVAHGEAGVSAGFGRVVAPEIEAPNLSANLLIRPLYKEDGWAVGWDTATLRHRERTPGQLRDLLARPLPQRGVARRPVLRGRQLLRRGGAGGPGLLRAHDVHGPRRG